MEVDNPDSNSDNDSDAENIEEVPDPEHNAPERIMDDLDVVEKAKNNDPEALEYLKREYPAFFDGNSENEALNQIEEYLEDEFPKERTQKIWAWSGCFKSKRICWRYSKRDRWIGKRGKRDNRSSNKRKSIYKYRSFKR